MSWRKRRQNQRKAGKLGRNGQPKKWKHVGRWEYNNKWSRIPVDRMIPSKCTDQMNDKWTYLRKVSCALRIIFYGVNAVLMVTSNFWTE